MTVVAPPVLASSPYKGLAPFEDSDDDAAFFFGRDREQRIITANLTAARLTLLYGASGVGKSSVLKAAVVRRLRGLPGPLAVVVFDQWRDDPGARLREAVAAAVGDPPEGSLADTLEAASAKLGGELYVILDGAEEYFVYHAHEREPGTFAADFPDAVGRAGLRANFLLALREDSLASLDPFKARIPNLFANSLRLDHLDRAAARDAIVGPIEELNRLEPEHRFEIESELVEAVLAQAARGKVDLGRTGRGVANGSQSGTAGHVETPYLSLVMERLWASEREQGSEVLRLRTLEALGGAEQIVRDHLDDALAALPPEGQEAAAEMFNQLVTPSGTKIAHRVSDLEQYADVAPGALEPTLRTLTSERILRPVAGANGSTRYEIFHDVLADAVLAWRTRHEADRALEAQRTAAKRRERRLVLLAGVAAAIIAVLAGITAYALAQRSDARNQATRAHARELVARSATGLSIHPVQSVELAQSAARLEPSRQTEDQLRAALNGLHEEAIFDVHAPVATVQFSPDGRLLAVAAGDETRVFRVRDHRLVLTLRHGAPVSGAWFDPNGRLIVTAGADGAARAWSAANGRLLFELHHKGAINAATFSADGRLVATAGADRTVGIWRATDGRLLHRLKNPLPVTNVSFGGDGTLLAAASSTGTTTRVFAVRTGRLVSRLRQRGWVTDVTFAPHGALLATGSADSIARIWDARTGKRRSSLVGHVDRVLDVDFDPEGARLVTASKDQSARIWDVRTGALLATVFGETNQVLRARFSPDGKSVVTASSDRAARVYDQAGWLRSTLVGHRDSVTDAVFSPDSELVATAGADGTARLWSWRTQPNLRPVSGHRGSVVAEKIGPDGRGVVSVGGDGRVLSSRFSGGGTVAFDAGTPVTSASFGGNSVILVGVDGLARLVRLPVGPLDLTLDAPRPVSAAALTSDGRTAATADARGDVVLWDAVRGRRLAALQAGPSVRVLSFSPDGRQLLTGSGSVARLWRVADGRLLHVLSAHRGAIVDASFSPDARRVATASTDATARIWSAETGKVEHVLRGHHDKLTSVAFSPNGRLLVTTSVDLDSRLWDVATGRPLLPLLRVHWGEVTDAAFTADGRWVVTVGGAGAGIFNTATRRILFLVRTRDKLPLSVATSRSGWRFVVGGTKGNVETYDCRLCAPLTGLRQLARERLARLEPANGNAKFAQR